MSKVAISPDVADILSRAAVEDRILRLPNEQLSRPLYQAVDKVLTALGGKWDRRAGGHVFPSSVEDRLSEALSTGAAFDEAKARIKDLQFFETPPELAREMVTALRVTAEDRCLEPSAGRGRIVEALAEAKPAALAAVEIDTDNGRALAAQGLCSNLFVKDFLDFRPADGLFTVVAMNPPFRGNRDIRHIRHAWSMLTPGGRLAAIASDHGFIGQEREAVEWREWLDEIGASVTAIPAGTFKESGTNVAARLILASVDGSAKRQDAAGGLIGEADDSAVPAQQGDAQ